ncbi:hypothetical protein [Vibrio harveyi]|uniref:hypothetical protein n=1 Tax=Vibrio harveyi TaxID=669 RepID=UPI0023809E5D|nr:hypothetical protein [Vibrio harveyi]
MTTAFYRVGTISAQLNSKVVTGHGTSWTLGANKVISGDVLLYNNSKMYEVEHVISDTEIHLFTPFQDANITQQPYAILRNASLNISSRIAASVAIAINQKQQQLNEFNAFLTSTAPTVNMTDATGNVIAVIPIPTLVKTINDLVNDASTITAVVQEGKTARDQAVAAKNASETALASVTTIKSEVTQLKTDVEGLKTDTETAKSAAASSASAAAGSVTAAAAEVAKAATEVSNAAAEVQHAKDQVAIAAGHASASATSESNAGASATAAANSAQLAQAAIVPMRNEAEMWEMIRRNKDKYAASQFVDFGNHYYSATEGNGQNINEGLWARSKDAVSANCLFMNRQETATPSGSSKVPFALTTVAGFVSQLYGFNWHSQHVCNTILFPEAPDGTVIYDSSGNCRGTGKPTLDLSKEVDPKYGDVAADKNEAVARAFEGMLKSGDFRNANLWDISGGISVDNSGLIISGKGSAKRSFDFKDNTNYEIEFTVTNFTGGSFRVIQYGNGSRDGTIAYVRGNGVYKVKWNSNDFSSDWGTNGILSFLSEDSSASAKITNVRLGSPTEEVVITPHDVFGMEYWLEEVSQAKPDVFDCGMVQSKATSSNGVATSASSRPQTYHAAFKGDTTTGHTSVNFFTATFEQQCKLAAKEENNLFRLNDGRIVQFRGRQKTFRGQGNGDWLNINPTYQNSTTGLYLQYASGAQYIAPQGALDSADDFNSNNPTYRCSGESVTSSQNPNPQTGVFSLFDNSPSELIAVADLCYMQIWGEVPRLNQGAYCLLNRSGTRTCNGTAHQAVGHYWWHSSALTPRSRAECFRIVDAGSDTTTYGAAQQSGYIGTTLFARDDERLYDAVYPDGLGGVIDYRVSANDMGSKEDAAKVFLKVDNSTYRGKERLRFTTIGLGRAMIKTGTASWNSGQGGRIGFAIDSSSTWTGGVGANGFLATNDLEAYKTYLVGDNGSVWEVEALVQKHSGAYNDLYRSGDVMYCGIGRQDQVSAFQAAFPNGTTIRVVQTQLLNSSVSGEFEMMDVFAVPSLLATHPDFVNGWLGGWAGVPGSAPNGDVDFTKKVFSGTPNRTYWVSSSGAWSTGDMPNFNSALSGSDRGWSSDPGIIYTFNYKAFAAPTKLSVNKPILNASQGLGEVWTIQSYNPAYGCVFAESLFGKIPVSSASGHAARPCGEPFDYYFAGDGSGKLGTYSVNAPRHQPVNMPAPSNESPAIKVMWSQAANNQQATMQFNWNELVYQDYVAPKVDTGAQMVRKRGERYLVNNANSALNGRILIWHGNDSNIIVDYTAYYLDDNNVVRSKSNDTASTLQLFNGNGWGDDSIIRIKDGVGTFINLNGDTCLYGTSELAIPYGYTKNQARAGSQVAGVDL